MNTQIDLTPIQSQITDQAAVYVGTYAKYNSGSLRGAWVDLTLITDRHHFNEICQYLHSDESDPEYMYQDCQGFNSALYSESGMNQYFDYIEAIKDNNLENYDIEAIEAFFSCFGTDIKYLEHFEDAYQGQYEDEREYSDNLFDECYLHDVPENIRFYIDYDKFCRDLFINDCIFENGFVFNRNW